MKCPIDGEILVISERQGVEIDYCPRCRGVWLDRGELDKIIERSARDLDDDDDDDRQSSRREREKVDYRPRKKKRKSILEELFDFD